MQKYTDDNKNMPKPSSLYRLIDRLKEKRTLTKDQWVQLISGRTPELAEYLFSLAREERHLHYGHDV